MTIRPTEIDQVVRPLRDGYYHSRARTYRVTDFMDHHQAGRAVELDGKGGWWMADAFEVVAHAKESIVDWAARHAMMNSVYGKMGVPRDYYGVRSAEQTYAQARADFLKATQSSRRAETFAFLPSRQVGKTMFADFEKQLRTAIEKTMALDYETLFPRRAYVDPVKLPAMTFRADSFHIYSPNEEPMSIIPPLEVPAAPVQPAPEPMPPESASVQMLRKLLEERRVELSNVEDLKARDLEEMRDLAEQLADLGKEVEQRDRHIAAAQASIDETLADIAKLGGRAEETDDADKA